MQISMTRKTYVNTQSKFFILHFSFSKLMIVYSKKYKMVYTLNKGTITFFGVQVFLKVEVEHSKRSGKF